MFQANREIISSREHKYRLLHHDKPLAYGEALTRFRTDTEFLALFIAILREADFKKFRFETPPVTLATLNRDFEFVLTDAPWLPNTPNFSDFRDYFHNKNEDGVITFHNLGRDALLVVPTPLGEDSAYPHIASFMRLAPEQQVQRLWQQVASCVLESLSEQPLWLSTAGGGVDWLHVRLDSRPKYYSYQPYTIFNQPG